MASSSSPSFSLYPFPSLSSPSHKSSSFFLPKPQNLTFLPLQLSSSSTKPLQLTPASKLDQETTFFDNADPTETPSFDPPQPPEDYVPPPSFADLPPETDDEIAAAYEEIYGPAYSGESVLGNDVYALDARLKRGGSSLGRRKREKAADGFEERVVQVRRVTKVVKGGKKMSFRAIVVVGNKEGMVGVGVGKAKEVVDAIAKSSTNARRNIVNVPMTKYLTFPHR